MDTALMTRRPEDLSVAELEELLKLAREREAEPDPLLSARQAAELVGISPNTWRSALARGAVPPPDEPGDLSVPPNNRRAEVAPIDGREGAAGDAAVPAQGQGE
jgi:hypothetical protein